MLRINMFLVALVSTIAIVSSAPAMFNAEYSPVLVDQGKCCTECTGTKTKYFSIADDSGPWLCGETCIRDSFYPIFHIFEKNLTKAASNTQALCHENGYTKY